MRIFANSHINRIYMHSGLQSLALNSGGLFIYVYLLKAGIALPIVLLVIASIMLTRLVLRLGLVQLVVRFGLRKILVAGTLIDASSFLLLAHVNSVSMWLALYVVVSSLGTAIYWTCYHAAVARLGDAEHRGAQVSTREAIYAMTGIVGPLLGALMLTYFGGFAAFAATAVIYAMAAIPMLHGDAMAIVPNVELSKADRNFGFSLAFSDGLVASAANVIWRISLFITLGESFSAYGGALAAAGIFGAAMGLGLGRMIDLGHHRRSVQIGLALMATTVLVDAWGYQTVWIAIAANVLFAVINPLYISSIMAPYYNAGQASACTLRFNVSGENGFDSGAGLGCAIAAALTWAGFSFFWPLLIGLVGCVGAYVILHRHQTGRA